MSRGCDRTIGPKTATKRYGGASARCSALSQPDRPSDSLAFTLPPTTISTFNAIWSLDRPFGSSGQKQPRNGVVQPQRHDPRHDQTTITTDAAQLDKAIGSYPNLKSSSRGVSRVIEIMQTYLGVGAAMVQPLRCRARSCCTCCRCASCAEPRAQGACSAPLDLGVTPTHRFAGHG